MNSHGLMNCLRAWTPTTTVTLRKMKPPPAGKEAAGVLGEQEDALDLMICLMRPKRGAEIAYAVARQGYLCPSPRLYLHLIPIVIVN